MASACPHFVLFPLMAQGHMNPAIDLAKLLAKHGAIVTIFTSPKNASRFDNLISRANQSGLQIQILLLDFHVVESAGAPPGCENMDQLPELYLAYFFMIWLSNLQPQSEEIIKKLTPPPSCIVADLHLPWTYNIAQNLSIPWIALHTGSVFCRVTCEKTKEKPTDDFFKQVHETTKQAYGMIVNSFDDLELIYSNEYKKLIGLDKIWCVGPVSLCNESENDKSERGLSQSSNSKISNTQILKWLDSQNPDSVLYVSLGSLCNLSTPQLIELGLGLEASKNPFIWVLRGGGGGGKESEEVNKWVLETGFEERLEERGLVIRGWAPQLLILSHKSIGAFLTHCGWNSVLEGICSGLPMLTLPLFDDQYCNEKLIVDELKIGLKSGKEEKVDVQKNGVADAIKELMEGNEEEGSESGERRKRVRELREKAGKAMEDGGSSEMNIRLLIQDIVAHTQQSISSEST